MFFGLYTTFRPEANVSAITLRPPPCGSDNDASSSTTLPNSSSSLNRRASSGMSASRRPRNSTLASTQSCEIVPSRRANTGYCLNSRAIPPSPNRRTNCRYRERPSGSCANANNRSHDDCSRPRMVSNSLSSSSPETDDRLRSRERSRAARAAADSNVTEATVRPASLSRATSANGASTSSNGKGSSAFRKPICAGHASSSCRSGGASRSASARISDHSGSGAPSRRRTATESRANRLRVQAVPGQPPLQPIPVPLPQGLAPRLEPFVHDGLIPSGGGEVAAQVLLHRAGTLDYLH